VGKVNEGTAHFIAQGYSFREPDPALLRAAQACALLSGRDYVLPDDIRHMALPVLSHRLILTPEARMKGVSAQQVLSQLIETVPVPTGRS